MPSPGKRLILGWVLLALCLGLVLPGAPAEPIRPQQPSTAASSSPSTSPHIEIFKLDLRRKTRHQLDANIIHRYTFDLRAGQVLDAVVNQEGVDVVVRLYAPDGHELFSVDSPNDNSGPEEIFLLAKSTGRYYAEVDGSGRSGPYRIWVRSIRIASAADRTRANAEELFHKAREQKGKHPVEAMARFWAAERLWKQIGDRRGQARALERVGNILFDHLRDWSKALEVRTESMDLYRSVGDWNSEVRVMVAVGVAKRQLGDLEGAEQCYRKALKLSLVRALPDQKANALYSLAILRRQQGDNWEALENLERALPIWRQIGNQEKEVQTLNNMGLIYTLFGLHQMAMSCFQSAMDRIASMPADDLRAQILTRVSDLYKNMGDLDRAMAYAQQALRLRQRAGYQRGEAVTLDSIGLIYRAMGDLSRARNAIEQALSIVRSVSDQAGEASARANLGLVILDQRDPRTALEQFNRALELAQAQGYREVEIVALHGIAQAERMRGNSISAKAALEKIPNLVEGLLKGMNQENPEEFLMLRQQSYELFIDLLVRSPAQYTPQGDLAQSFELNERSRWRSLLEALRPVEAREGFLQRANPVLLAERTRLREALSRIEEERHLLARKKMPAGRLAIEQERLAEKLGAVDTRLRLSDTWATDSNRAVPVSLREAQNLLDSDTILLEYRLGRERSFLWLLTTNSAEIFTLPPRSAIAEEAGQLHDYLSEARFSAREAEAIPAAKRLSEVLLGPIADRLKARKLIIVRDGALHEVPFSALPDPQGRVSGWRGDWPAPLLLRHDIVYLPSVSVLKAIRSEISHRKPHPRTLAMLAAPSFAPEGFPPLPHSEEEGRRILRLFSTESTLSAFGPGATRDLVMSGRLAQYGVLHFATHAVNNLQYPELSSIVLSQVDSAGRSRNGKLRFQDIRDLSLSADLVVLSACQTALGKEVEGEGPVGLAQAFMYAGASRVVVSLWNVDDESTPSLMERFYRELLPKGSTPAGALNSAQRWMAQQPRWRSPYYWAGFELQGEWR